MTSIFDQNLDKNPANYVPLSPVGFVERSAEVFGDLTAVIHGQRRYTWAQTRGAQRPAGGGTTGARCAARQHG